MTASPSSTRELPLFPLQSVLFPDGLLSLKVFEARYLDGLIGRFPADEDIYVERSPLTHVDRIAAPVLILQGADDPVVPPSQSEMIRDALAARGVPHAYVLYPGESHGFRSRDTIIDATQRELAFLAAAWGFVPEGVAPLSFD